MSREPRHDFPALPAVETLRDPLYAARDVTLGVLRLDLLHPLWGGNKLFKLLPNLRRAEALGGGGIASRFASVGVAAIGASGFAGAGGGATS